MKYGISACLTLLAVTAMLIAACGGGGGGGGSTPATATTPLTPQAVVYISLSTAATQKSIAAFSFKLSNGTGATTINGSAEPLDTAELSLGESIYDQTASINAVKFAHFQNFTISTASIVKIPYTWQSAPNTRVVFRVYSAAAYAFPNFSSAITAVPRSRVDYFDSTGTLVTPQ